METKELYKSVEWAYPTSNRAELLGFAKDGCWSVELSNANTAPRVYGEGFVSKTDAFNYAKTLPQKWSIYWLQFNCPVCGQRKIGNDQPAINACPWCVRHKEELFGLT